MRLWFLFLPLALSVAREAEGVAEAVQSSASVRPSAKSLLLPMLLPLFVSEAAAHLVRPHGASLLGVAPDWAPGAARGDHAGQRRAGLQRPRSRLLEMQLDRDAWKAERRAEPLARYEQGAKGESAENKPDFPVVPEEFTIFAWMPFAPADTVLQSAEELMERVGRVDSRFKLRLATPTSFEELFPNFFAWRYGSKKSFVAGVIGTILGLGLDNGPAFRPPGGTQSTLNPNSATVLSEALALEECIDEACSYGDRQVARTWTEGELLRCFDDGCIVPGTPDGMFELCDGSLHCVQVVRAPLLCSMTEEEQADALAQTVIRKVVKSQIWLRATQSPVCLSLRQELLELRKEFQLRIAREQSAREDLELELRETKAAAERLAERLAAVRSRGKALGRQKLSLEEEKFEAETARLSAVVKAQKAGLARKDELIATLEKEVTEITRRGEEREARKLIAALQVPFKTDDSFEYFQREKVVGVALPPSAKLGAVLRDGAGGGPGRGVGANVRVAKVEAGGQASAEGLQAGDRIEAVQGVDVSSYTAAQVLRMIMGAWEAASGAGVVDIEVTRSVVVRRPRPTGQPELEQDPTSFRVWSARWAAWAREESEEAFSDGASFAETEAHVPPAAASTAQAEDDAALQHLLRTCRGAACSLCRVDAVDREGDPRSYRMACQGIRKM